MLKTRNRKIGLLALLLAVVLAFTVLPEIPRLTLATDEAEIIASGECGDDAEWTLTDDGVLAISGTGEMDDYGDAWSSPWYDYRGDINKITIESGITKVGAYTFCNVSATDIYLSDGLKEIGSMAFAGVKVTFLEIPDSISILNRGFASNCSSLEYVKLPSGLETIPNGAFRSCTSLTEITLPDSLVTIDEYAFYNCTSLASVTIPDSVTFVGVEAFPDTTDVQYPDDLSRIEDGSYKLVDNVYVTGALNYEYAYEVLDLVNEERAAEGYEPLMMDTELLEAAMQRAAENSLYYSHTRPCGLSSMTMIESHALGENIAAGYTTPTAVMTAWMNSSGHRTNILMSSYQSIGIGCFYSNGYYYWVQLFTHLEAAESALQENYADSTETMSVMIEPDLFQDYLNLSKTSVSIDPGESTPVTASMTNSQTAAGRKVKLEPESFTWTSSDPTIATVDASGQITGVNPGTATITAATTTTGELYRTVDVTVIGEDLSGCTITLSDTEYTYDGTAKEPAATVTFNGKTLVRDVDYTLSYSNNTTAGTGYAVVTGIEAYSGTAEAAFTIYPVVTPDTVTVAVGETATITTAGFPGNVYSGFYSGEKGVVDVTSDDNGQLTVTGLKAGTVTAKIYGTGCVYEDKTSIESLVTITVTDGSSPGDTDGDGSGSGDTGSGDTGDDGSGNTGSGGSSSDDGSDAGSDGSGDEDTDPGNDDSGNTGSGDNTGTSGDTLMVRRGNTMYFNYTLKGGNADFSTNAGRSTDQVLVGDWDGDGVDTICLRRGNVCYFIDDITTMHVYLTVTYGRPGDEVLVGDWDGDRCDSLAMRRNGNYYFFCNDITNPDGDTWSATYGRAADEVHVGDWEGRGYDSLAVRRDGNYYYFSLSKVTDPNGDVWVTTFGRAGDEVLVGDWDANGTDTLAMRRNGNTYFISNSIANPDSDVDTFTFGRASDEVYAGKWR